ncbi:MAG: heme ABC transporter ATP-binding protein [Candidatus Methanospirareceae archaeon]
MTLEIKNVDAYYGSIKVLESIDFSAEHGEFLGIIGPNGSGKTTLLRTISRILKPKIGAILLDGEDVRRFKDKEFWRKFAAVPQETAINFDFSALDIVLMGRNPHLSRFQMESEKDIEIARRSMELTNCWHLAERRISELSGGEKQRVIIARALAQQPKVLLLDEPTSHLDINHQIEIMDLLKRLTVEEKLIVISAIHDLNLAAQYCDRLILLHKGKIVSIGKPKDVLTPENIKKAFNTDVIVKKHPLTNMCYILTLPHKNPKPDPSSNKITVHLICGGGEGAPLMHILHSKGYRITAGVVNLLDTDYEVARHLHIKTAIEAPFSPITEEAHHTNLELIQEADVIVLCSIPFGFGNLKNIEAAGTALGSKPVLIFNDNIEERDFTEGMATKKIKKLIEEGAIVVKDYKEVEEFCEKIAKIKKGGLKEDVCEAVESPSSLSICGNR